MPKAWHADVRYGSKADIATSPRHVRFTPESGHQITDAKSEHSQLFDDTIAVAPALLMRT